MFSLYLYKIYRDRLLIYDLMGLYIYMSVLKILLSYYFIDLCHFTPVQTGTDEIY